MARTTRKNLLLKCEQAISIIDRLDIYLMEMDTLAAGRQPAIDLMKGPMIDGHEAIRRLWKTLFSQL